MSGRIRFPLVDSLRAIGALGVLGTHAGAVAGIYVADNGLGAVAARLDVGVTLFFLVSGFLLYRPFARARVEQRDGPRTAAYAWRRFLRIAPAYWVALTLGTIAFSLPGVFTLDGIPTFYLMAQGYRTETIGGGIAQGWTLTVEVAFYAFLPLFAWLMTRVPGSTRGARLRGEFVAIGLLFAGSLVYKLIVLGGLGPQPVPVTSELIALPAYLDHFSLGMLLAVTTVALADRDTLPAPLALVARHSWAPWLVALLAFFASTRIGLDVAFGVPLTATQYMERHLFYALVGFGLLLPAVIGDDQGGMVRRLMATRTLVYLGLVSYGIYLYNLFVMSKLDGWGVTGWLPVGAFWSIVLFGLLGTVAVASGSWYLIERPALRLKSRVTSRRREKVSA